MPLDRTKLSGTRLRVEIWTVRSTESEIAMVRQDEWHSEEAFWALFEPVLFSQERCSVAAEQVAAVVKLLQIEKGAQILDLCCGIGRHTLDLAARGFAVTGIDRTERYIQVATDEAKVRGLSPEFILADMRDHCAPDRYDVVLNLFGSFGYFDDATDDVKVANNIWRSLRPGGQFLVETTGKEILARDFQQRDWSHEDGMLLLSEKRVSRDWGRMDTHWIAMRDGQRSDYHVSVRIYAATEMVTLFRECGFSDLRVYGSLDGTAYDHAAQRLVVTGRK